MQRAEVDVGPCLSMARYRGSEHAAIDERGVVRVVESQTLERLACLRAVLFDATRQARRSRFRRGNTLRGQAPGRCHRACRPCMSTQRGRRSRDPNP